MPLQILKGMAKKTSALLLAAILIFTPFVSVRAEETQSVSLEQLTTQTDRTITMGQFAMLINAQFSLEGTAEENFPDVPADHFYAEDLSRAKANGYLKGDERGNVRPDAYVSGAEAAVVINNLLGFDASQAETIQSLKIADWAKPAASLLIDLSMATADMVEKESLTVADAMQWLNTLYVARMFEGSPYTYSQEALADDFYAYTNRQYLMTAQLKRGYIYAMAFSDPENIIEKQQKSILTDILTHDWKEGSDEWKASEVYHMYMDNDARTQSLSKLQPYFDEVNNISSISELIAFYKKYDNLFNAQPFYGYSIAGDAKVDATKWAVIIRSAQYGLGSRDYYAENEMLEPVQAAYKDYIKQILAYINETNDLEARAASLFNMERDRAAHDLPQEVYADPQVMYTSVTWDEMLRLTATTKSFQYDEKLFNLLKQYNVYCPVTEYIQFAESQYTAENLRVLKDYALLSIFDAFSGVLGDEIWYLSNGLSEAMFGQVPERRSLEERAQSTAVSVMSDFFSEKYAETFCSEEVKQDVTDMVNEIRDKYRERIQALDWMSRETKEKAVEKLDAIQLCIAYPDEPAKGFDITVTSKENGGNLIDLTLSHQKEAMAEVYELLEGPANVNVWRFFPTSTVNAFYYSTYNAIIIPAGILQSPFYNVDNTREQNLGAIGAIIAHEITHAFDNNGAQMDKNGTLTNWWTEADYAAFSELTANVSESLAKIELMNGSYVNGVLCTGETIADLGAVACVLDIAKNYEDSDPAAVMEAWSGIWAARMSPEVAGYLLSVDNHAPNKVRVNFVLSQMPTFYEVYGISEEDGMFIPAGNRIRIW